MRKLNVILEISKHVITPLKKGVNTHRYFYKIKRIEVFDQKSLIKGIEILDDVEVLVLRKDGIFLASTQYVFNHYINSQCITYKIYFNPAIDKDVLFSYDYAQIDDIVKKDVNLQWLI